MDDQSSVPDLGPLEFQLLQILWEKGSGTAREVLETLNAGCSRPLKYTTVMTLLTRMVEKQVLQVERERQPFLFTPLISRERLLGQRVRDFVDQFFDGSTLGLAVRLVETGSLSDESMQKLERMLRESRGLTASSLGRDLDDE